MSFGTGPVSQRPNPSPRGARSFGTRAASAVLALVVAAAVGAGCGDQGAAGSRGNLDRPSKEQQRQDYVDSLGRMQAVIEDPNAEPFQRSIDRGKKRELLAAAARWDQATAVAEGAQPPRDVAGVHRDLVKAMRGLGDWNRRIAAAAPNRSRTRRIARQAQNSPEAKAFDAALSKLEAAGYLEPAGGATPLDQAGSPAG